MKLYQIIPTKDFHLFEYYLFNVISNTLKLYQTIYKVIGSNFITARVQDDLQIINKSKNKALRIMENAP